MRAALRKLVNIRSAPIEEMSDEESGDIPFNNNAKDATEDNAEQAQEEEEEDEDEEGV